MITRRSTAFFFVALPLALAPLGCGKTGKHNPDGPGSTEAGAGANGAVAAGGNGGNGSVEVPLDCSSVNPGPSPLSRLGNRELNGSLSALLPKRSQQLVNWLDETSWIESAAYDVTTAYVEQVHRLVHDFAQLSTTDSSDEAWLKGCDLASEGEEACRDALMDPFLERAYRRAVTDEDREEMRQVYAEGKRIGGDFASGMRAVVEVALQSPDFMYLIEQGTGKEEADAVQLSGFETAARLSYFLTGGPPDDELFAVAKQGPLDPMTISAQAARLLGTPENRATVRRFYGELMRVDANTEKPDLGLSLELARAATEGAERFIEDVTFDGAGTFRALLTEPSTWATPQLARYYGYPGTTAAGAGTDFEKLQLDPQRYAGVFTQPAYLAASSHGSSTSPVQRSLPILTKVLCYQPPPPPPDVGPITPNDDLPAQATTRERLTHFTAQPVCMECHRDINPIGFAFESFDQVGKWRDTENGTKVDTSGVLTRSDAAGPFGNAVELMQHIAESDDAKACFVTQWLGHAYRRAEVADDGCSKAQLVQDFAASDGKIVDLLRALAQSDNFRYRLKSELAP